jgi:hypothetical protein
MESYRIQQGYSLKNTSAREFEDFGVRHVISIEIYYFI